MGFQVGHKGFRTKESYKKAGKKIAEKPQAHWFKKGHSPWSKTQKGIHLSLSTEFKKGVPPWNKGRKYVEIAREKHPNWKGGITPIKRIIRESIEYKLWRDSVFSRDNWTCVKCKVRGGYIAADHIKMFAFHPELRFAIDNGRTLCRDCHKKLLTSRSRKHVCCK